MSKVVVFVRRDGSIPCPMHSEVARTRRGRVLSFYLRCAHLDGDSVSLEEFPPWRSKDGSRRRTWVVTHNETHTPVFGQKRALAEYERLEELLRASP